MINIKRAKSLLINAILLIGCLLQPNKALCAEIGDTITYQKIMYQVLSDSTVEMCGNDIGSFDYTYQKVTIPEKITADRKSYNIVSIGDYAFKTSKLYAMYNLPETVVSIGDYAFYCSSLTTIDLPQSLKSIGKSAFRSSSLAGIVIPDSITAIEHLTFSGCLFLQKVTLSENIKSIGNMAFQNCQALTSINIPESVVSFGSGVFYYCTSLSEVTFAGSDIDLGTGLFQMCTSLTTVKLPDSLTSIGNGTFDRCTGLTTVDIPESVTIIGENAFYMCRSLKSLKLPNNLKTIGASAFSGVGPISLLIPKSVTTLSESLFESTDSTISVVLPLELSDVPKKTFYRCTGLSEVFMGPYTKSLGSESFKNSSANSSIYITALNPPSISTAEIPSGVTVYVDPRAVEAYKADTYWGALNIQAMTVAESLERGEGLEETLYLSEGEQKQLTVDMMPSHATVPHIFWYSTNPEVASVDINGLVTYHGKGDSGIMTLSDDEDDEATTADSECRIVAETLYHEGPMAEFVIKDYSELGGTNSIEDITLPAPAATNAPAAVYNLQGIRVSSDLNSLPAGIYIVDGKKQVVK